MASATVIVNADLISVDPTGEPCDYCGETPWLSASEIVLTTGQTVAYLCADCVSLIRENAEQIQ